MIRPVLYLAHPVSGDVTANVARALRWLKWLRKCLPAATIIAPWIAGILSGEDDSDPAQRARGLEDCIAVVPLCDGVILTGGRVSTGMRLEAKHARRVYNLNGYTSDGAAAGEPPAKLYALDLAWLERARVLPAAVEAL